MRRVGIDVGGTNTDAVLIENNEVAAAVKAPTTEDVMSGVDRSLHPSDKRLVEMWEIVKELASRQAHSLNDYAGDDTGLT